MSERATEGTFEQIAAEYWGKIVKRLPSHLTPRQKIWINNYLQAQVAIYLSDQIEAREIFTRLDNEKGFLDFEEKHPEYFATMEVVARGKSSRDGVRVLFRREDL